MDKDSASAALGYLKILVPFDGSAGSTKALRRGLMIARRQEAELTVLSVDEHVPRYAPAVGAVAEDESLRESYFRQLNEQASALARKQKYAIRFEGLVGHAAQTILQAAQQGAHDLIVIGHSGHSGVWGSLLGSTTARVVDQAACDVLVVR